MIPHCFLAPFCDSALFFGSLPFAFFECFKRPGESDADAFGSFHVGLAQWGAPRCPLRWLHVPGRKSFSFGRRSFGAELCVALRVGTQPKLCPVQRNINFPAPRNVRFQGDLRYLFCRLFLSFLQSFLRCRTLFTVAPAVFVLSQNRQSSALGVLKKGAAGILEDLSVHLVGPM